MWAEAQRVLRTRPTMRRGRGLRLTLAAVVLVLGPWSAAAARAAWTTYRGDGARSGMDVSSSGPVKFAPAWTSPTLGGKMWAQPLVYGGRVIVATQNDSVYSLSETTGKVAWHVSAGTAVPAGELPCGNISPTVGITSTPVIDPATKELFVVADTWDGSDPGSIEHLLYGFNLKDGSTVSGFPVDVDPPGSIPADQLQRTALALDAGKIVLGYGGNDGDCGTYNGWLVAVPETGGSVQTFEVDQGSGGGAIWGSGDGAALDATGDLLVATGNGFGSTYGYQESVLKLDSNLNLLDHWAPSNWQFLDNNDIDLGSGDPLPLPNGLLFEIGKAGEGYLLSDSNLGGTDASPVFSAQVCDQTSDASFGGAVYHSGVIYVTCSDGLLALSLNLSARTFSAVSGWQVHSQAIGPPIIAGDRVWATGWNSAQLFGLAFQTGHSVVDQVTPGMEHFTTPAASDGMLFLATGKTVEAYTIAHAAPAPVPTVTKMSSSSGPVAGGTPVVITGNGFSGAEMVRFGATRASFTSVNNNRIVATAPAHTAGTVNVTVTTTGGTSTTSTADLYTYGPPTVRSLMPAAAITGAQITITGTGFAPGAKVAFGTRSSPSITVVSRSSIQATVPNGAVQAPVSVTTAGGTGASSTSFSPTLSVTSYGPSSGPAGTVVAVRGIGFTAGSTVAFNGVDATTVTFVSSTKLTATVPPTATTGPISVTNDTAPVGTVRSASSYTVLS